MEGHEAMKESMTVSRSDPVRGSSSADIMVEIGVRITTCTGGLVYWEDGTNAKELEKRKCSGWAVKFVLGLKYIL